MKKQFQFLPYDIKINIYIDAAGGCMICCFICVTKTFAQIPAMNDRSFLTKQARSNKENKLMP